MTFYRLRTLPLLKNFQERMMHHCSCLHHTTRRDHIISFWVSVTDIISQGKGGGGGRTNFFYIKFSYNRYILFYKYKRQQYSMTKWWGLIIPLLHAWYFDISTLFSNRYLCFLPYIKLDTFIDISIHHVLAESCIWIQIITFIRSTCLVHVFYTVN